MSSICDPRADARSNSINFLRARRTTARTSSTSCHVQLKRAKIRDYVCAGCGHRERRHLMRVLSKVLLAASALALTAASQAYADTVVPVTPPDGAVATIVFGINNRGVIAGIYVDSAGVEHGFFGPLNGSYTTFDLGGTTIGTEPRALNDAGDLTGFAPDPSFTVG